MADLIYVSALCAVFLFVQNFGLDYDAFQHMVGDCPPDFLQLAFNCCNVSILKGRGPNWSFLNPSDLQRLCLKGLQERLAYESSVHI